MAPSTMTKLKPKSMDAHLARTNDQLLRKDRRQQDNRYRKRAAKDTMLSKVLRKFIREHKFSKCPYDAPEILLTHNGTDSYSKVLELLVTRWSKEKNWAGERDGVLVSDECVKYGERTKFNEMVRRRGCNIVPIATQNLNFKNGVLMDGGCQEPYDEEATEAEVLDSLMRTWSYARGRRPHVLYVEPCLRRSLEYGRRGGYDAGQGQAMLQDIYEVCQSWDIMIVEDASGLLCDDVSPSFMDIDVDGRVIRVDSFHVGEQGADSGEDGDLGWVTAQPDIINRLQDIADISSGDPSKLTQRVLAEKMFGAPESKNPSSNDQEEHKRKTLPKLHLTDTPSLSEDSKNIDVKIKNLAQRLESQKANHRRRMDVFAAVLDANKLVIRHTPSNNNNTPDKDDEWTQIHRKELYTITSSHIGPYFCMEIDLSLHPLYESSTCKQRLAEELWVYLSSRQPGGVVTVPYQLASQCVIGADSVLTCVELRLCISGLEEEALRVQTKGLIRGIKEFFEIEDEEELAGISKDAYTDLQAQGL